jgi:hypothetical protein
MNKLFDNRFFAAVYNIDELVSRKLMKAFGLLIVATCITALLSLAFAPFFVLIYVALTASLEQLVRGAIVGFIVFAVIGVFVRY